MAYFLPAFFLVGKKKQPQKLIYCTLFTCEEVQSIDAYTQLNVYIYIYNIYIYLYCMYDLKTKLIYSVSRMQMNMLCFLYIIFCQLGGGIFLQVDGIGLRLSLWLVAGAALKQFFGFEPVIGKDPLAVDEGGGKAKLKNLEQFFGIILTTHRRTHMVFWTLYMFQPDSNQTLFSVFPCFPS